MPRTVVSQPNKAKRLLLAAAVLLALTALLSSRGSASAATTAPATATSAAGSWESLLQGFGGVPSGGLYLGPGGLLNAKPPGPISPFFP